MLTDEEVEEVVVNPTTEAVLPWDEWIAPPALVPVASVSVPIVEPARVTEPGNLV